MTQICKLAAALLLLLVACTDPGDASDLVASRESCGLPAGYAWAEQDGDGGACGPFEELRRTRLECTTEWTGPCTGRQLCGDGSRFRWQLASAEEDPDSWVGYNVFTDGDLTCSYTLQRKR